VNAIAIIFITIVAKTLIMGVGQLEAANSNNAPTCRRLYPLFYARLRRSEMSVQPSPRSVLERLLNAQNQHDLEMFLDCFDPDYQSEQPVHPDRAFTGREQVRKNWSALFSSTPDFRSELLSAASEGDTGWAEWRWFGTRTDGTQFEMRGVTIFGVRNDRIAWGRLYMEEVLEAGAGIDAVVQSLTHNPSQEG
jgi:ketosteroid isomerase-like protein